MFSLNVLLEKQDQLAIVTINRPEVRNALDNATIEEIDGILAQLEGQADLRVVIFTGAGDKAFVAGADIREVARRDIRLGRDETRRRQQVYNRIADLPVPSIAAVNGFCLGAGLELALGCTLRIAAEGAKFGAPEINLGIIPGGGATQRLPRLVGTGKAMEMVLTGEMIDAQEALRIGLVNLVVPLENLMPSCLALAGKLAAKPPLALRLARDAVNRALETSLAEGLDYESYLHALTCATEDKKEGVAAFLAKRKPQFTGN